MAGWHRRTAWRRGVGRCGSGCLQPPPPGPSCSCWQPAEKWPGQGATPLGLLLCSCWSGSWATLFWKLSGALLPSHCACLKSLPACLEHADRGEPEVSQMLQTCSEQGVARGLLYTLSELLLFCRLSHYCCCTFLGQVWPAWSLQTDRQALLSRLQQVELYQLRSARCLHQASWSANRPLHLLFNLHQNIVTIAQICCKRTPSR